MNVSPSLSPHSQASQRLGTQDGLIADDIGNGVDAIKSVLDSKTAGEEEVVLSEGATKSALSSLNILSKANDNLWTECCSTTTIPVGCTVNNKTFCPQSCCGERITDEEAKRIDDQVLAAASGVLAASSSAKTPNSWASKSDRTTGQSLSNQSTRKSGALLMDSLLSVLTQSGQSICRMQFQRAIEKNQTTTFNNYVDEDPYVAATSEYVMHAQAMHLQATTKASDDVSLTHLTAGTVTGKVSRFSTTSGGTRNGCRIIVAFFNKLTHHGDGEPAKTPVLPTVALKLSALDSTGTVTTSVPTSVEYTFGIPLDDVGAARGKFNSLIWENAITNWVLPSSAEATKVENVVTIVGATTQAFTGKGREAAVLQSSSEFNGIIVSAAAYDSLGDSYCFACIALPVYWGLFIAFFLLAMMVSTSYDSRRYKDGTTTEAIDHSTTGITMLGYLHMWIAPLVLMPLTLGYYKRHQRVVTLFTFFMIALALCAPFYDNEKLVYEWEHSVDTLKAVYSGVIAGLVGWLVSSFVRIIMFPGPLMPKKISLKRKGYQPEETDPLNPSTPTKAHDYFEGEQEEVNYKLIPAKAPNSRAGGGALLFFLAGTAGTLMIIFLTNNYTSSSQGEQYMLTFLFACLWQIMFEFLSFAVMSKTGHYEGAKNRKGEVEDPGKEEEMSTPPSPHPYHTPNTNLMEDPREFGSFTPVGGDLPPVDGGFRPSIVGTGALPMTAGRGQAGRFYDPDTIGSSPPAPGLQSVYRSHTQNKAGANTPLGTNDFTTGRVRQFDPSTATSSPFVPSVGAGRGAMTSATPVGMNDFYQREEKNRDGTIQRHY